MASIGVTGSIHQEVCRFIDAHMRGTAISAFTTVALRDKMRRMKAGYPFDEIRPEPSPSPEVAPPGRKFRLDLTPENAKTIDDLEALIERKVTDYRASLIRQVAIWIEAGDERTIEDPMLVGGP